MLPDQSGVTVIANNNFFAGRNGLKPQYIVLHGTAGGSSAVAIANYFATTENANNATSSHYVIGTDGVIVQCVAEADGAWANGFLSSGHAAFWDQSINPNLITISIEHCKPSNDNSNELTDAQRRASFGLIRDICKRWNIPARAADAGGGITGHFSIDPVNRSRCPGPYPWDALWKFLQGGKQMLDISDPLVQRYFREVSPDVWECKANGVRLLGANLTFYRSNGGPALFGLPVANEVRNAQYPGTAILPCERVLIVYDPQRTIDNPPIEGSCYLLHIDSGIGQKLLLQAANPQVQELTNRLKQINTLSNFS